MDINAAKSVMLRTHLAALAHNERANGLHLESGPGIGKSDGTGQYVEQLCLQVNEPTGFVPFMLATISSVDVRGFMLPVKDNAGGMGTLFSTPPWYPTRATMWVCEPSPGADAGFVWHKPGTYDGPVPRVGVLFLDEFSQAEDEIKKPAAELIYKGSVGTCELPVGWRVISAGNRMSDRSGVMRELMFIVNRRGKLTIDALLPPWLNWANSQPDHRRPHYMTLSFAQKNPNLVFRDAIPAGSEPFCTPRTLCLMDRDLQAIREPADVARNAMPTDTIARELCTGWIGAGETAQYFTHLKYDAELPEMSAVEKDPMRAKLPPNKDAQMVCGYMLAGNVNNKNALAVVAYLERLMIEMQVLTVRAITMQPDQSKTKAIMNTSAMSAWLIKNQKLLIASRS